MKEKMCFTKKEIIDLYDEQTFNEFKIFMRGQTVMVLDDGSNGYYIWDFRKFLDRKFIQPE